MENLLTSSGKNASDRSSVDAAGGGGFGGEAAGGGGGASCGGWGADCDACPAGVGVAFRSQAVIIVMPTHKTTHAMSRYTIHPPGKTAERSAPRRFCLRLAAAEQIQPQHQHDHDRQICAGIPQIQLA